MAAAKQGFAWKAERPNKTTYIVRCCCTEWLDFECFTAMRCRLSVFQSGRTLSWHVWCVYARAGLGCRADSLRILFLLPTFHLLWRLVCHGAGAEVGYWADSLRLSSQF